MKLTDLMNKISHGKPLTKKEREFTVECLGNYLWAFDVLLDQGFGTEEEVSGADLVDALQNSFGAMQRVLGGKS